MRRIAQRFEQLRKNGEKALVVFLSAGDPDLDTTDALVLAMAESGADLIEIGVPFSDPVAEGPTIQRSSERGLASGASLRRILERVERLRSKVELPLLLMGYANPFYAMGAERFAAAAGQVGVDGILVVDLPPEEGHDFFEAADRHGIDAVLMATPTTPPERMKYLVEATRGFLYYVSLTGVTGARGELASNVQAQVDLAKSFGDVPVCVGFGVSKPEHARELAGFADGVVVGSAIVDRIESAGSREKAVESVASFVEELKRALS
jgi:tryptophan synthase alpha chain